MSPSRRPVPQPKPSRLFGNVPDVDTGAIVQSLMQLAREWGPIFKLQFPTQELVVVSSQALVNELCDEARFDKKIHGALRNIRDLAGDGLFTAETEEPNWGKAHRILLPAFGPAAMRGMFDGMLDIAEQLLLKWERQGEQQRIDVADNMTRLTLDTIALCGFDYRFNSFYEREMHPFVGAMIRALAEAGARTRRLPVQTRLMLMTQRQYAEDIRLMHGIADELVALRKQQGQVRRKDLLSLMLSARDPTTGEGLNDLNIRYQMVTFLIAGHETTSGLLSFALYLLLQHPAALARAREEADQVFGGETPQFEHLSELVYTDQVLKETLRLWPTAPAFGVYPYEDEATLGGAYDVRKDQVLLALLPMLHRDRAVWGENPEAFDPDRFAPAAFDALPPNAWKPFGNGQRACIGRPFAMQEATLVLAMILHRFEIVKADPAYTLRVKETLTLKPQGFFMRARRREIVPRKRVAAAGGKAGPESAQGVADAALGGNRVPVRVLFGSNSGSAEAFAQRIATDARQQGYVAQVSPLDVAAGHLPREGAVVIVTASYEGHPPDNARAFVAWCDTLGPGALSGVRYAVFGCGNKDWARTYQAVPKQIDTLLARAGAERILERGEADARADFFGDFDRWYAPFWPCMGRVFGQTAIRPAPLPLLEIEFVEGARDALLRQNELQMGEVIENRELVDMRASHARSKRHLEIALPAGARYRTGDYLAVLPMNPQDAADRALRRFGLPYDAQVKIHPTAGARTFFPTDRPVTAGELLSSYVELAQPATRLQIGQLATMTPCPPEKAQMESLIANDTAYAEQVLAKRVSVLDLLERFGSCALPFGTFLQMLSPLKPRQYSISSSPAWREDRCTITVAIVTAPAWSGQGVYEGIASSYLARARPGAKIAVITRPSQAGFHPPETLDIPMVMVCAGSGIAPFRGFLQERAIKAQDTGEAPAPALLFFGCDHPDVDYLYREELADWERDGIVTVRPAFSEAPEGDVRFVQHRLWQDRAEVMALMERGARIYVCGDGKYMAPAVREMFGRMYQEMSGAEPARVDAWLAELETSIRYVQDVFG